MNPVVEIRAGRVAVAMSGGVDSSTVAAMLVEAGVDCVGLTMQTWPAPSSAASGKARGCCSLKEIRDAERVAWSLGIPHYTLNLRDDFERTVIADFVREYAAGRTPNPCVRCNQYVKFERFFDRARAVGAERVATGHYARIRRDEASGRWWLLRGLDNRKDQSYVLYTMTQEHLERALFPIGDRTKQQTRDVARRFGLCNAEKRDSVEICFLPEGDHGRFVTQRAPDLVRPGDIVDLEGRVLGEHRGLPFYTVGQRRGIGIASSQPLYVIRLEREANRVVLGPAQALERSVFVARDPNWIRWEELDGPIEATARIRYNAADVSARISPAPGGEVEVHLPGKARAISPGQAVVFYDGEVVLGGATIDRVLD